MLDTHNILDVKTYPLLHIFGRHLQESVQHVEEYY